MQRARVAVIAMVIGGGASAAVADDIDRGPTDAVTGHTAANDDQFTPGLFRSSNHGQGTAVATLGYDGAAHATTVDIQGDVKVWGPIRLIGRVDNAFDKARPGVGAAVQFLDERRNGVAATAYVVYKTEGFTELEGEVESLVSFGKQLGPVHGTMNLAYGQDPEGAERDGEVAIALHIEPTQNLFTGVVGWYRDALGSNGDKATGILRDALGGASATYVIGRFGVTGTAGIAAVETVTSGHMSAGPSAQLAIGAVF